MIKLEERFRRYGIKRCIAKKPYASKVLRGRCGGQNGTLWLSLPYDQTIHKAVTTTIHTFNEYVQQRTMMSKAWRDDLQIRAVWKVHDRHSLWVRKANCGMLEPLREGEVGSERRQYGTKHTVALWEIQANTSKNLQTKHIGKMIKNKPRFKKKIR